MFIRSQSKSALGEYKEIYISKDNIIHGIIYHSDDSTKLGNYETKERAIEVLNEIQSRIINEKFANIAKHDLNNTNYGYGMEDFIYEMPQQ